MQSSAHLEERGADGAEAGVELEAPQEAVFPFDPEEISITPQVVPLSYLLEQIEDEAISAPQIQRDPNLWNEQQQSRLIESLMLRIPLPLFYVSVSKDDHWHIIDGLQRISAIRNYILDNQFPLSGLEFLYNDCKDAYFSDLPAKYKKRIRATQLQFAVINATTPPRVQRTIFKRLNTGGLPLSAQEIRHALYYGNSANFLKKLSTNDQFVAATTGSINDSRMVARELILRFIAFLLRGVEAYPRNEDMDGFLCETMQFLNAMPDVSDTNLRQIFYELPEYRKLNYTTFDSIESRFIVAMERAHELFDRYAFRKSTPAQGYRTPINKALFDTISVILAEMPNETFNALRQNIHLMWEKLDSLLNKDLTFPNVISRDSLKWQSIEKRFEILKKLFYDVARS